jgi:hypothetical protein
MPRSTTFSSSLASTILDAVSLSPGAAKLRADGFDAGKELVLRPANTRKLLPNRIPALLVLPLVDRTVVAAGNILGNVGFWHADREPGVAETDGVFEYLPHQGPVAAIVAHPALPHKVILLLLFSLEFYFFLYMYGVQFSFNIFAPHLTGILSYRSTAVAMGVKFVIWTLRRRALILSTRVTILFIHSVKHQIVLAASISVARMVH